MTSNSKLFIGFCGGAFGSNGVGKTTATNFLVNKYDFHLCDLSYPVGESAKKLCTWDGKKNGLGLAILNQACISGKRINENYWLNLAVASIPKEKIKVVFDNVYFKNEADFIHKNGGFVIHIEREGFQEIVPDFITDIAPIINNSSINDFEKKIDELLKKITTQM